MRNFMKSKNPMFNNDQTKVKTATLERKRTGGGPIIEESSRMSVSGAVNKTFALGMILMVTTVFAYLNPSQMFMTIGALGGAAVYMFTSFKPHLAPITAPLYALLKGLLVGAASAMYAQSFGGLGGIIFQAASLTIATLLSMLMIYKSGLIKVTKKFRMGVTMAVGAIMIVYLISWIGMFAGFTVPFIHDNTPIGIAITAVIICVAAMNLLLDFDNFDRGEQSGAPKYMEWYYGMGLLFTLVWLYIEFLRLLSKIQSD